MPVLAESMAGGEHGSPAGEARAGLVRWVREGGAGGRVFLQTHLLSGPGGFSVRHVEDRNAPATTLRPLSDPFAAREIAQTREDGEHRPLKTAPDLQRGWRFEALDDRGLWTVMDYLYPACVNHWHASLQGTLRVTHWSETAGRQSGMYSPVRLLEESAVHRTVRACCADEVCMRRVAWGMDPSRPDPIPSEREDATAANNHAAEVPCPEACSIFVSLARTVLRVEREPRTELEGLGHLAPSEVDQLRSLVEAGAAGDLVLPREGEFDLPLNRRRLRYLALRLTPRAQEDEDSSGHG